MRMRPAAEARSRDALGRIMGGSVPAVRRLRSDHPYLSSSTNQAYKIMSRLGANVKICDKHCTVAIMCTSSYLRTERAPTPFLMN
eukprot:4460757-Pleurochrysis_carterae.AAC.1